MSDRKKYTLDNSTEASNPGKIEFNHLVWFRHKTISVLILFSFIPIFAFLSFKFSYFFIIGLAIAALINLFYWVRAKEHFTADSNPGLIVSESPPLYAVYTDLTKGFGHYPVIKIQKYDAHKSVKIGDKIATVAVYSNGNGDDSPCWSDFFPLPVEYATDNQDSIRQEMESYSDQSWLNIDNALENINDISVGLFKITNKNSNW